MEKQTPAKLRRQIDELVVPTIREHFSACRHLRIFLFGSRVSGQAHSRSDVDIGIDSDGQAIGLAELQRLKAKLEELDMLHGVDVVDFNAVEASFAKVALEHIEVLYEH